MRPPGGRPPIGGMTTHSNADLASRWRDEPAPLLPLLHALHERDGHLSDEALRFVAKELRKLGNRFDQLPTNAKMSEEAEEGEADATSDEELSDTERKMLQALGYVE